VKVGFIGLGAMGLPMAKRVAGAGYETFTTYRRREEPARELASLGAAVLESPAAIARAADVVITILPADRELKDVVLGPDGVLQGLGRGKILVDMTTATAMTMQEVGDAVAGAGGETLDAPVSGGTPAAADGSLTIMVGGDPSLLEKVRPLLATMGQRIIHVGGLGQGKVVKMVNQALAAGHLLLLAEAFALGVRCGASPDVLYDVIKTSSGHSRMMDLRLPGFLLEGRFDPGFRLDLMKKDVDLALASAHAHKVPVILSSIVGQLFAAASVAGHGDADFSAAGAYLAATAGVRLDRAAEPDPAGISR
jgi:3-hydroxyisobutyrate dehydrogenase-like beta-hydroxyacid dehydrogenase